MAALSQLDRGRGAASGSRHGLVALRFVAQLRRTGNIEPAGEHLCGPTEPNGLRKVVAAEHLREIESSAGSLNTPYGHWPVVTGRGLEASRVTCLDVRKRCWPVRRSQSPREFGRRWPWLVGSVARSGGTSSSCCRLQTWVRCEFLVGYDPTKAVAHGVLRLGGSKPITSINSAMTLSSPSSAPEKTSGANAGFVGLSVTFVWCHESPSSC